MNIILFDVDHTLIRHSTARHFIYHAVKKGILPKSLVITFPLYYLKYRFGVLREETIGDGFPVLEGKEEDVLTACAEESIEEYILKDFYPEAREIIEKEQGKGNRIVLATSSVDLFIEPLARHLGADYIASRLEFEGGVSTGKFSGKPAFGEEKKAQVTEYLEKLDHTLDTCRFYSDSYYDLPLLSAVGEPVAVNPDIRLRKEAKKNGWNIKYFRRGA